MANITTQQLAEIIIGVARSQQAIIDAVDSQKTGFKGSHLAPALDNAAKSRVTTRPLTLQEFPARVLLQCMGRAGPNVEQLTRDLEALLSGQTVTPAAPAATPAAPATAADGAQSLDMT
ncbi:MAG TPA: hypothetical protein VFO57_11630 [Burkholderiales bacterium]|nr:hypothetical protein [Burkholderiales bacterium]